MHAHNQLSATAGIDQALAIASFVWFSFVLLQTSTEVDSVNVWSYLAPNSRTILSMWFGTMPAKPVEVMTSFENPGGLTLGRNWPRGYSFGRVNSLQNMQCSTHSSEAT